MEYLDSTTLAGNFFFKNHLSSLDLIPGVSFFIQNIHATKQKGFGRFNLAGYYPGKYRAHCRTIGLVFTDESIQLGSSYESF